MDVKGEIVIEQCLKEYSLLPVQDQDPEHLQFLQYLQKSFHSFHDRLVSSRPALLQKLVKLNPIMEQEVMGAYSWGHLMPKVLLDGKQDLLGWYLSYCELPSFVPIDDSLEQLVRSRAPWEECTKDNFQQCFALYANFYSEPNDFVESPRTLTYRTCLWAREEWYVLLFKMIGLTFFVVLSISQRDQIVVRIGTLE